MVTPEALRSPVEALFHESLQGVKPFGGATTVDFNITNLHPMVEKILPKFLPKQWQKSAQSREPQPIRPEAAIFTIPHAPLARPWA